MMIKKRMSGLTGLALGVVVAASVMAGPTTLQFTNLKTWGQSLLGGPFEVIPSGIGGVQGLGENGASASDRYLTFCVEYNEHVGKTTYNAKVNTEAINGGIGGGNPDPLDARTAFLYTAFIKGTLDDKLAAFDNTLPSLNYGLADTGDAIQAAIWAIEQEKTFVQLGLSGPLLQMAQGLLDMANAATTSGGEWFAKWGLDGIGNVRILNLTDQTTGDPKQDQLVLIPLPAPALAIFAGLLVVGGVSTIRRRRLHL